jgi:hypothetical protein
MLRTISTRRFLSTSCWRAAATFGGPAPPRLPEKEQKLYEELQRSSTGAFSTPRGTVGANDSGGSNTGSSKPQINQSPQLNSTATESETLSARVQAKGDGEELHPDIRRGAKPEFEGERNPKTGEIGGPKNEPLRWGGDVDWSYNGRVTDF